MKIRSLCSLFISLVYVLLLCSCGVRKSTNHKPDVQIYNAKKPIITNHSDSLITTNTGDVLLKNEYQLWEMYIKADNPLELGYKMGALYQPLYNYQEEVFFDKIQELIPSKFKQKLLQGFLKWYNRKLYLHVPEYLKSEIYGVSEYASDKYDYLSNAYLRNLYMHGAHDIGHAFEDLALVGCSSIALSGENTQDGKMLIGRNFDFYLGDDFAKNKIVSFIVPPFGYKFMSVGWAGMSGVVSGMNEKGLTVTINASKSDIPLVAKKPIAILAREILQNAANIQEAVSIAKESQVFVSESIMIGSKEDKKAILIEISPKNFDIFELEMSQPLICTNHFQSKAYQNQKNHIQNIEQGFSKYRFERIEELLKQLEKFSPNDMVKILRDYKGLNDKEIGLNNEKSINQLHTHHSVVFQPEDLIVWVSTEPYQLGTFIAFDLNKIFGLEDFSSIQNSYYNNTIASDIFIRSDEFADYQEYRILDDVIDYKLKNKLDIDKITLDNYQKCNPEFWKVYYKIGCYYQQKGYYNAALSQYKKALEKEVTTQIERTKIQQKIKKIERKLR
ncbi:MAG: C45 family peptidase [Bacteroidota bacterium]|nr:C45 family peptidase [Bacteroidota bacterium]